jgi:hypothetical protein
MKAKLNKVRVQRITVDEKLSPDICRFTVCSLRDGKWQFKDRGDEWLEEQEKLVNSRNYYRTFHVKKSEAPAWESLEEGQVYLSGEFEAVGEPETEKFRINPGQTKIMRIDNLKLIKEGLRALYSDVMGRD